MEKTALLEPSLPRPSDLFEVNTGYINGYGGGTSTTFDYVGLAKQDEFPHIGHFEFNVQSTLIVPPLKEELPPNIYIVKNYEPRPRREPKLQVRAISKLPNLFYLLDEATEGNLPIQEDEARASFMLRASTTSGAQLVGKCDILFPHVRTLINEFLTTIYTNIEGFRSLEVHHQKENGDGKKLYTDNGDQSMAYLMARRPLVKKMFRELKRVLCKHKLKYNIDEFYNSPLLAKVFP